MNSNRTLYRCIVFLLLACFAFSAQAQMYRWTDKEGRVHYTDTPPPPSAVKSEEKSLRGNVASSGDLPYATQEAMKKYPVRLYTAKECEPCKDARALLNKRGVPFREIVVGDEATRAELKKLTQADEVPVLAVGNDIRKGYEAGSWNAALDSAGYPKSGPVSGAAKTVPQPAEPQEPKEPAALKGPYSP